MFQVEYLNQKNVDTAICQKQVSNFANNYDFACFFEDSEPYHSKLYVITRDLKIKYFCRTDCFIHCCGISDTGKYVIFQTANAPDDTRTDGNKRFFVNIEQSEVIWKLPTETKFQTINGYFIDENRETIIEYHADYKVTYDFKGNFLDKYEWLHHRANHADATFYELLSLACELMRTSTKKHLDKTHEQTILNLINSAVKKGILSEYQIANTYKMLGDYYFDAKCGEKALKAYKAGLFYNSKLPVKRIIKKLSNSLGINE